MAVRGAAIAKHVNKVDPRKFPQLIGRVRLAAECVRDVVRGGYRLPWKTVVALAAALAYFITPLDVDSGFHPTDRLHRRRGGDWRSCSALRKPTCAATASGAASMRSDISRRSCRPQLSAGGKQHRTAPRRQAPRLLGDAGEATVAYLQEHEVGLEARCA